MKTGRQDDKRKTAQSYAIKFIQERRVVPHCKSTLNATDRIGSTHEAKTEKTPTTHTHHPHKEVLYRLLHQLLVRDQLTGSRHSGIRHRHRHTHAIQATKLLRH